MHFMCMVLNCLFHSGSALSCWHCVTGCDSNQQGEFLGFEFHRWKSDSNEGGPTSLKQQMCFIYFFIFFPPHGMIVLPLKSTWIADYATGIQGGCLFLSHLAKSSFQPLSRQDCSYFSGDSAKKSSPGRSVAGRTGMLWLTFGESLWVSLVQNWHCCIITDEILLKRGAVFSFCMTP